MPTFLKRNLLWILYFAFVAAALVFGRDEPLFSSDGPYAVGKILVWVMFFGFLGFSLYCSAKESFLKSLPKIIAYHWGRQISLDLYISMFFSLVLIWLVEGSVLVLLLWLLPVLIYANLAVLLYIALNYHAIIAHFAG